MKAFLLESKCLTLGTSTVENAQQNPAGGGGEWAPMELIETLMRHLNKRAHKF